MKIACVVGARPNYMKIAPVVRALGRRGTKPELIHTGQHYDDQMSKVFFDDLGMPRPDRNLEVGSGSHARQTAAVMVAFEDYCIQRSPQLVLVGGDVNSTAAVALVCAKLGIPVGHVESGLRSFDRSMPEEVNRVITDHMSSMLFTTEESANANLRAEGIPDQRVHFVGITMIDSLDKHLDAAINRRPWLDLGLEEDAYGLVTLHRPSNVDDKETLTAIMGALNRVASRIPLVYPVHPRTRQTLEQVGLSDVGPLRLCDPMSYLDFVGFMARARCVFTDSGGIQEETTALGVPCLTIRENTERPVTLSEGSNRLVGTDPEVIVETFQEVLDEDRERKTRPQLWDGQAAERVADVVLSELFHP